MNTKIPEVSIIMPLYNVENYVRKSLDSVVAQTFKDFELIIINDCSTDNSLSIVQEYEKKDSRFYIVNLPEHKDEKFVRNEGLKRCRGKYITFIDSDDWVTNDYIEILYANIKKFNVDIVAASFSFYNNLTKEFKTYNISSFYCSNSFSTTNRKKQLLSKPSLLLVLWTKMYNKDFLIKNNMSFKIDKRADALFIYEAFLLSKEIKFINVPIYYYRRGLANSITSNKFILWRTVQLIKQIKQMLLNRNLYNKYIYSFLKFSFLFLASDIADTKLSNKKIKYLLLSLRRQLLKTDTCTLNKIIATPFYCMLCSILIYKFLSKVMRFLYRTFFDVFVLKKK